MKTFSLISGVVFFLIVPFNRILNERNFWLDALALIICIIGILNSSFLWVSRKELEEISEAKKTRNKIQGDSYEQRKI